MNQRILPKRVCMAISPWTNIKCHAKAVNPNTVKKGTKEFLDERFCQMHQPGMEPKKKCVCPHCNYHRSRDKFPIIEVKINKGKETIQIKKLKIEEENNESGFGVKSKRK